MRQMRKQNEAAIESSFIMEEKQDQLVLQAYALFTSYSDRNAKMSY